MNQPWEKENCDEVFAYYSLYPVPVAAALWCGVPPLQVQKYLDEAMEITAGIWRHPSVRCLEVKCRAMHNAIIAGDLTASRENGIIATDHIKPERRHVSRQNLKEWIAKEFPGNKPAFLFDEIERKTHRSINSESFQALQADLEATKSENEKLRELAQKLRKERDSLHGENQSLKAMVEKNRAPDPRTEATLLNIIGGLLKLMLSSSPAGKPLSAFDSQSAIINALQAHCPHVPGISERTLQLKFAEANRSLTAT